MSNIEFINILIRCIGSTETLFFLSYTDLTHEIRTELTDPLSMLLEARFEPCQVCGEQSSGLHCGAITCEACKVRRNTSLISTDIVHM